MMTETYRGVRLKVTKGWGEWIGRDEAAALQCMHGYVDGAIERPEAYPDYWKPGYRRARS